MFNEIKLNEFRNAYEGVLLNEMVIPVGKVAEYLKQNLVTTVPASEVKGFHEPGLAVVNQDEESMADNGVIDFNDRILQKLRDYNWTTCVEQGQLFVIPK